MNRNRLICCLCLVGLLVFAEPLRAATAPAAPAGDVEQQGLPTGRFIAGGIVGTAVGLGNRAWDPGAVFPAGPHLFDRRGSWLGCHDR